MKQTYFFISFTFFLSINLFGQEFPSRVWHEGKLVSNDGDTLSGLLKYDQETDVVQLQLNKKITKTYTALSISYFEIKDATSGYYRFFYSIPFKSRPGYAAPQIFELLNEGDITLLSREAIVTENNPQYNFYRNTVSRQRLLYSYYILEDGKDLYRFNGKRAQLLEIMKDKEDVIKKYIRKNRLKTDEKRDIVRIVAYYNALEQDS